MKRLVTLLAALAVLTLTSLRVHAQAYGPLTLLSTGKDVGFTNSASWVLNRVMKVTSQNVKTLGLQVSMQAAAADTTPIDVRIDLSNDNVNWTKSIWWQVTPAGNTLVTDFTNINLYAMGYVRLTAVTNTHASVVITNVAIKASFK
jgi:hypothetical protein